MKFSEFGRFGRRINSRVQQARYGESGSSTWQAVLLVITVVILGS